MNNVLHYTWILFGSRFGIAKASDPILSHLEPETYCPRILTPGTTSTAAALAEGDRDVHAVHEVTAKAEVTLVTVLPHPAYHCNVNGLNSKTNTNVLFS